MINKQGFLFLVLTSLILVLSVYYINMPSELISISDNNIESVVKEIDVITSLRESDKNEMNNIIKNLTDKLNKSDSKNDIYDEIKSIRSTLSLERDLEKVIYDGFKLDSFVKIKEDGIDVVCSSNSHDNSLVVKIINSLESKLGDNRFISVSFK